MSIGRIGFYQNIIRRAINLEAGTLPLQKSICLTTGVPIFQPNRGVKLNNPVITNHASQTSAWGKLKKMLTFGRSSTVKLRYYKDVLSRSGTKMYFICAEYPVYLEFVEKLRLPDTFQTWFSITALHVWLCLVRLRHEGEDGRVPRETIFRYFTGSDIISRARGYPSKNKYAQLRDMQGQLYCMIMSYDEGLLSRDDRVLAGAVWRSLFHMNEEVLPQEIELIVAYIHRQLAHLDGLSSDQILGQGYMTFLPLIEKENKSNEEFFNIRMKHALYGAYSGK